MHRIMLCTLMTLATTALAGFSLAATFEQEYEAGVSAAAEHFDAVITLDLATVRDLTARTQLQDFLDAEPRRWDYLTGNSSLTAIMKALLKGDETRAWVGLKAVDDGARMLFAMAVDGESLRTGGSDATILTDQAAVRKTQGEHFTLFTDDPDFSFDPTSIAASQTTSPAYTSLEAARGRWNQPAVLVWVKPSFLDSVSPLRLADLGITGVDSGAFGLSVTTDGQVTAHASLSADMNGGFLDVLFREPEPLSISSSVSQDVDGLFVSTFDGRKMLAYLQKEFEDDPETLNEIIQSIEENLVVSADSVMASLEPEQALIFTNMKDLRPSNMHWNSITLFQRAGVVALKSKDDLARKALAQLAQTIFEAPIAAVKGGDVDMTVANLIEVEDTPLLRAFFGRYDSWTAAGLSYNTVRDAAKTMEGGGTWERSARVREIFGGAPPDSSGLAYLDLPPALGWPLMLTSWGASGEETPPPGLSDNWDGIAVNLRRLPESIDVDFYSGNLAGVLATWLEAGLTDPLPKETTP